MKAGTYSVKFTCDGYAGYGSALLDHPRFEGAAEDYGFKGKVTEAGHRLTASLTIDLSPGVSGNAKISGPFMCEMTGNSTDHSFDLYGVGLLGIIIGMQCQWAGSLDRRVGDRSQRTS